MTRAIRMPPMLRVAARVLFWLTLVFVAIVTLSPIADRPETPFGPTAERFGAFALVSGLLMLGYPSRRLRWFCGLVLVAALLEAGQNLVGGRHGRMADFGVKACGVSAGALAALAFERFVVRLRAARLKAVASAVARRDGGGSRPGPEPSLDVISPSNPDGPTQTGDSSLRRRRPTR